MTISQQILIQNSQFLMSLPRRANSKIGVDQDGRLYSKEETGLKKISQKVSSIFKKQFNVKDVINSSLIFYFNQEILQLESARVSFISYASEKQTFPSQLDNLHTLLEEKINLIKQNIEKLKTNEMLSDITCNKIIKNIQTTIHHFYECKLQLLNSQGKHPLVVNSIIAIEMSQDPLIQSASGRPFGAIPTSRDSGRSGSYLIRDINGENIAIFKPGDEEVYTTGNTRGYPPQEIDGQMFEAGVRYCGCIIGTSWKRETTASILD